MRTLALSFPGSVAANRPNTPANFLMVISDTFSVVCTICWRSADLEGGTVSVRVEESIRKPR